MRAVLLARAAERRALPLPPPQGDPPPLDTLYFGCRRQTKDFLFGEELEALAARGEARLITAFSRDGPPPPPPTPPPPLDRAGGGSPEPQQLAGVRCYVTHRLVEDGAWAWECLSARGGAVLVAGSAGAMPRGVHEALLDVACRFGGLSAAEAAAFLKALERQHRYCVEAYG